MARYRILSLDGGGIRGVITTVLLQRLSSNPSLDGWLDKVDLIAGTSTGGLLALGLAYGLDLQEIRDLYEKKGASIFNNSLIGKIFNLGRFALAGYNNKNLVEELKSRFKQTTLDQLPKKVLIPSFDLDNEGRKSQRTWKPKLFHNYPGTDSDGGELVYKVGLYTSAAPTYFRSVDGYVDGGVYANNPSMCALAQALDSRFGKRALTEISLLSLGTGTSLEYIENKAGGHNWGLWRWAKPVINLMMDGVSGIADYQCKQLLSDKYHRLSPVLDPDAPLPLDAVDRVPDMVKLALNSDISVTVEWIKNQWMAD